MPKRKLLYDGTILFRNGQVAPRSLLPSLIHFPRISLLLLPCPPEEGRDAEEPGILLDHQLLPVHRLACWLLHHTASHLSCFSDEKGRRENWRNFFSLFKGDISTNCQSYLRDTLLIQKEKKSFIWNQFACNFVTKRAEEGSTVKKFLGQSETTEFRNRASSFQKLKPNYH